MKEGPPAGCALRRARHRMDRLFLSLTGIAVGSAMLFLASAAGAAEEPVKKVPVSISADNLDYDRTNDVYTASGHVRIKHQEVEVEADRVMMNNRTGEAVAEGNVFIIEKSDVIMADRVEINLTTRTGVIDKGDVFKSKENYHMRGSRIERRSESAYHIEDAVFTTCDRGEWYLRAREMDVDLDRYATGSGVSFNMAGLPVIYTPYLLFPVRRQSGLLIPEVGYGSTDGFVMKNAVFWAMSDNRDMTFLSDYRARTGLGTGAELRYVSSRDSAGKAFYNYFDTFDGGTNHWLLKLQHREEFAEDLTFRADFTFVSDQDYFRAIEKKLELRAQPYVDSNAFYVERWNTASLYLLGQYSTDLSRPNGQTLQRLPELRYTIYGEPVGTRVFLRFEGSAVNMTSQDRKSVLRADFKPELDAVVGWEGLNLTPRVGARATFYDQGAGGTEPAERKYLFAGADLNARFSRVFGEDGAAGIGRIRHSIEPSISYSYLPRIDENGIPRLDAVDDVREENLITLALINRLTARYLDGAQTRTFDLMVFRLAGAYDVNEARRKDLADPRPRSEIQGELAARTPKLLTASASANYNTYINRLTATAESVAVTTDPVQVDVTHQYLRDPRTRFLIPGIGLKFDKWTVHGQLWRDVEHNVFTQQTYKAHYASQCWGLGLEFTTKPGERNYLFAFDLKGLGTMKF